jgi:predicted nucleic acid-binding protein/ribosomal protein S18 acetylase RimI-like enzyme
MTSRYLLRRDFSEIAPFLEAIRIQADSERTALGFLPQPAYEEAAQQRKLILLLADKGDHQSYAGHLLFGGIFPTLKVRQISIVQGERRSGHASRLLRALVAQGEKEGYLSIVANVATDLEGANAFYEKHGFVSTRLKPGGSSRNRRINVRILQLETPSLLSIMTSPRKSSSVEFVRAKKRSLDIPIYAIDLNVFFDAIRKRERSNEAGAVFEAALRHQIRLAASQEFIIELQRTSHNPNSDPILSLAKRIPILPPQDNDTVGAISPLIAKAVFPERSSRNSLTPNDTSDALHLAHAVVAGVAGYITSDEKILRARDRLMEEFDLDVIGLSEFVELLDLPAPVSSSTPAMRSKNFRIQTPSLQDAAAFFKSEAISPEKFLASKTIASCERLSISDNDGTIGILLIAATSGINQPYHLVVCVRQEQPYSSTVADFLISEALRICSRQSACHLVMMDVPSHPITHRVAVSHGFQPQASSAEFLTKIAIGRAVTAQSWNKARLSVERISGIKLQKKSPDYSQPTISISTDRALERRIGLFELETLLSPALFSLRNRRAVIVPITRTFAADLLGTDLQYSFLDVPEAKFLSRRTYFNTTRATRCMIRGAVIAFYESSRGGGRGAIVAIGRIVDVTSVFVGRTSEALQRGAVVEDLGTLTKSTRILASSFDNLLTMKKPVTLKQLRQIDCVPRSNFVSATPISAEHLSAIVDAGWPDD